MSLSFPLDKIISKANLKVGWKLERGKFEKVNKFFSSKKNFVTYKSKIIRKFFWNFPMKSLSVSQIEVIVNQKFEWKLFEERRNLSIFSRLENGGNFA